MRLSMPLESEDADWDELAPGRCRRFVMGCKERPHLLHVVYMIKQKNWNPVDQSSRSFFLTAAKRFLIFSFLGYVLSFSI